MSCSFMVFLPAKSAFLEDFFINITACFSSIFSIFFIALLPIFFCFFSVSCLMNFAEIIFVLRFYKCGCVLE